MHSNTRAIIYLLWGASIFLSQYSFSQKNTTQGIAFMAADKSGVSVFIILKDLPKQRFLFTVPEIFTAVGLKEGLFNYDRQPWHLKGNNAEKQAENGLYAYHILLQLHEEGNTFWVNWKITFENKSTQSLYDLAAFNCLNMNYADYFKDTAMTRTYVKDQSGKTISVKTILKTQGDNKRTMQFYLVAGGIEDLTKNTWPNGWGVTAPTLLSGNSMWVESVDAAWKIETIVDGQVAYFFNNWEADHGCIHASPLLAKELKPGETSTVTGSFRFTKK